jgi:hypothetical protein
LSIFLSRIPMSYVKKLRFPQPPVTESDGAV